MPHKKKMFFYLILIFAVFYALLLIFAATAANYLIFPAPNPKYAIDKDVFFIELKNGEKIAARFYRAQEPKCYILYAHGNREDLGVIDPLMRDFRARGYSVLAYDYIGYGHSTKSFPTPQKLCDAVDAAYAYLVNNLQIAPSEIVSMGYSLGSAAACRVAEKHSDIKALVLVGGFASIPYAIFPFDPLPWNLLGNAKILSKLDGINVLLMHGTRDITVAPRNARINYKSRKDKTRLVWFKDFGHKELFNSPAYWVEINNIIQNKNYEKSTCITVQ